MPNSSSGQRVKNTTPGGSRGNSKLPKNDPTKNRKPKPGESSAKAMTVFRDSNNDHSSDLRGDSEEWADRAWSLASAQKFRCDDPSLAYIEVARLQAYLGTEEGHMVKAAIKQRYLETIWRCRDLDIDHSMENPMIRVATYERPSTNPSASASSTRGPPSISMVPTAFFVDKADLKQMAALERDLDGVTIRSDEYRA